MVLLLRKPIAVNCWNDDQGWKQKGSLCALREFGRKRFALLKCRIEGRTADISFYDFSNKEDEDKTSVGQFKSHSSERERKFETSEMKQSEISENPSKEIPSVSFEIYSNRDWNRLSVLFVYGFFNLGIPQSELSPAQSDASKTKPFGNEQEITAAIFC